MVAYGMVMSVVKRNVQKLLSLKEYAGGITMSDFVSLYSHCIGRPLSYHDLGYTTLYDFISDIPDVARIQPSEADPGRMVVAMASTKSKNYRSARQAHHKEETFNSDAQMRFDPEVENLEPDRYGRFSLCLPLNDFLDFSDEDVEEEFSAAGDVIDVHRTAKLIFVRFNTKEELQNCLDIFGTKHDMRLGRQSNKIESSFKENQRRQNPSEEPTMRNHNRPQLTQANHREGPSGDADRRRGGRSVNHSETNTNLASDCSDDELQSNKLFISNIESKEDFEKMIQSYRPKKLNVVVQDVKKYAFVTMWNHRDALNAIRNLDGKMQSTRKLSVKFNKGKHSHSDHSSSFSDSCTEVGTESKRGEYHNGGAWPKTKAPKENGQMNGSMPKLESSVDFSRMPPLVPNSEVIDPSGLYDLDTSVLVKNFPPRTMESQLRAVFKGYRVLDICVLNNGFTHGCTSALLYMSTIYEAIRAIRDNQRIEMDGYPLKVVLPEENILLKKILIRMETGLRDWS